MFDTVKRAFKTENGIDMLLAGFDLKLKATKQLYDEYEEAKTQLAASHPAFRVYCTEQTAFALALVQDFDNYREMLSTAFVTRDATETYVEMSREARGLLDRAERELAKAKGLPFMAGSESNVANISFDK